MRCRDSLTWSGYKIHIGQGLTVIRVLLSFSVFFFEAKSFRAVAAPPNTPSSTASLAPVKKGVEPPPSVDSSASAPSQPSEIVQKQTASTGLMTASIEKQKTAAQSQLGKAPAAAPGTDTFFTTAWASPAVLTVPNVVPTCTALAEDEMKPLVEAAAKSRNLQIELVRSVIKHESDSYPCAISDKGALGLMQLMPEVAQQLGVDPMDPKQNIEGGSQYLKQLLDRYKGDVRLALAAYNAGPQRVDTDKKVPDIPETVAYVDAILKDLTGNPALKINGR